MSPTKMTKKIVLKHKNEWPELIKLARRKMLSKELTLFLLALREVENGEQGTQFNVKAVKGTNLEEQAKWAIGAILKNELRWQDYIRKNGHIDYITFFVWVGGPHATGWHPNHPQWGKNLRATYDIVRKEFEHGFK